MFSNLLLSILWVACASSWHYPYNVTEWGQEAEICERGTMQSPIDLLTHPGFQQHELDITVGLTSNLTASHVHSLHWTLQTDKRPAFYKNGVTYELLQWHCHTGSEHTVDGYQYPGECHFVHYSDGTGQYAVIGVFLNDTASTPNAAFSKLLDELPATADWKQQKLNINFDWHDIISGVDLEYYWSYIGSFTTPGCNENVQWTVLRDIVAVTASQIEHIESTSGYDNNFRPPAPLHGRVVEDGSEIVNSSVTWAVSACCFETGVIFEIKSSLALVLGLSLEDIKVISVSNLKSSWIIYYSISVVKNTITFVRNLLENLEDDVFMAIIKAQIEADLNSVQVSTFVSLSVYSGSSWHYPYNVTEWGEAAEICANGKMQSPVNLPPHPGINQSAINTTLSLTSNLVASRLHSLQWSLITENYPTLYVKGLKYKLVQWHCHTGSEHTVDGYQYPGECHFVHKFSHDSGSEYAVLGVFLNDNATSVNPAFSALLRDLPANDNWEELDLDISFDWSEVISGVNLEYYWSYTGSFTTPNCAENVQWTVLRDVVDVTPSQIEQIMMTSGFDNNFRPPMALYGRVIEDGSKMVKFNVMWTVSACCMESKTVLEMTNSVALVLGISTEDIQIHSFSKYGENSWTIEYEITVSKNTHTFLTFLSRNLEDDKVLGNIKSRIENDIKTVKVTTFESVSVSVDSTYLISSWHYPYEVTEWGAVAEICEYGTMQSPIDLPAHPGIKQSKINTTLNVSSNLIASHKHSLQWDLVTENHPNLYINGMKYNLVQWHCHTGSEHTVNRYQYPGECHFVHSRGSGSQYAVIGFFLSDGATTPNTAFSDLLDDLPPTDEWVPKDLNINFDWSRLISSVNLEYYWSYIGSFTTPGCDEDVQWTVLRDVVEVTPAQIRQIEVTSGFDNNFRPPTLLHGRVLKDGSELVNTSLRWTVTVCCIGVEDLQEMTSSVGTAVGLSADDIEMISFTGHGESTYDINWEITIFQNTQTFLRYLVQNLDNEEFIEFVKDYIEERSKTVTLSRFDSLVVDVPTSDSGKNEAIEAIIICLLTILFVCLVTIAVNLKKYYLQFEVAHHELDDQMLVEMK